MQKILTFVLTLVLLLVSVEIKAQTSNDYLNMGFEDCTTGAGNIPSGWNNQDYSPGSATPSSMNSYLWYVANAKNTAHSGSKYAYLYCNKSYSKASRLKTPASTLSSTKEAKVSFWLKNKDVSNGDFSLYVSTDGGANYLQNPLCQHILTGKDWTLYEYSLMAFKGQTITLVFEGASNTNDCYYYIDDIVVTDAPSCQVPINPNISDLTGTSATFNWGIDTRYGATPAQYSVTLKDISGNVLYYNSAETASGVNFTNLQNNTTYIASVRSDCSAAFQGYSDSVSVVFITLPIAVNPPFYENFDNLNILSNGYYTKNATINTTGSYSYGNSGKSVKLTTTATDNAYIVFPLMNIAGNDIEMSFKMRRAAAVSSTVGAIKYKVGYITDPYDLSTFVPVLQDSISGDVSWRDIRFNTLSTQDSTTPVMGCIFIDDAFSTSVYIDEVEIHEIPTCTRPEHVSCVGMTDQSVSVSWDMAYAASFLVKAISNTDTVAQMATQSPYTLTGLTPNTEYEITVQGVCSAADSSDVSHSVIVKTLCSVAETTTFFEGAEGTTGTAIPDCWRSDYMVNRSISTAIPFQTATAQKIGTRSFSIPSKTAGTISYLCSQALDFDQSGIYSFRYQIYRTAGNAYSGEGLKVYVTPAVGDLTNAVEVIPFIPISAGNAPATTTTGWNEYEGIINYQGTGYIMVVFYHENGGTRYIDNLEVYLTPSCLKVKDVILNGVTTTSADVTWTPGDDETQWIVDYTLREGSTILYDSTTITTSANLIVNNLTPATKYNISGTVRAICGQGDTSEIRNFSVSLTTDCIPMTSLPYSYSFEDATAGISADLPLCWNRYNDATTNNRYPYVSEDDEDSDDTYARTGTKYLNFYSSTNDTYSDHQVMILPVVDVSIHPINTLRLRFWAKRLASSSAYCEAPMIIGVMSDPSDLSTFVTIDTIVVGNREYDEFVVSLESYVGNGAYVAMRLDRQPAICYCYIDDISLEQIPECLDLETTSVMISSITDSSAMISLVNQDSAIAWSYAYGIAETPVSEMTIVDTNSRSVNLTGLSSVTRYDLYVRRNCGNGDYSPWSSRMSFTTASVPAQIPYVCGFENDAENNQWQFVQGAAVNNFAIGAVSAAVHSGTQSVYVSTNNGSSNSYASSPSSRNYAARTIHFDAKGYQIEYYWRCSGGQSVDGTTSDYGRVMLLPVTTKLIEGSNGTNITTSDRRAGFPEDAIFLNPDSKDFMALDGDEWHHESLVVNMVGAPGNYNLVFVWNNDASAGTLAGPLAIDDITITELTCVPPASIQTSTITDSSAILYVSQAEASLWEFVVDTVVFTKDDVPANPLARIISADGNASLTGLTANTEYFYSARTICCEGDTSAWYVPAVFRTFCSTYDVPYSEGFENTAATNCWSMMTNMTDEASVTRATIFRKSGVASLKVEKASAVSPELEVDSLTHYKITGWAYATTDNATFDVGVVVDPNDAATYESFSNIVIPAKNTWTEFTTYFNDLADPDNEEFKYAKNIVLACGTNTIYFDDLSIDLASACPNPTNVTITNVGAHSFDISFVDNASASQWIVYTNGTPNVITTNPATVSNLSASTIYNISIAAVCSESDTSYAADCGMVHTLCDKVTTPWTCGFEVAEGYAGGGAYDAETTADFESNCWTVFNQKPNGATYPYAYVTTNASNLHSGGQGVYIGTSTSATKDIYMMMPDIDAPSNMLRIKLWYKNSGTNEYHAELKFGYFIVPTDETTFVPVVTFPKYTSWTEAEVMTNTAGYNIPAGARIGFMCDRGPQNGYNIYLDDISVNLIRNCSDPDVPTVSDITSSTAKVSFLDTCASHTAWEYVYGTVGFDPNTATSVSIDTTEFILDGLTAETDYVVYVRAVCGEGDESNYVPASFKTFCTPFHVTASNQFVEDFNDYNYGQYLHNGTCYYVFNEPSNSTFWAQSYPTSLPSATAKYYYNYGHSEDRLDRCLRWSINKTELTNGTILRQFHLDAGTTYEITAWVRNGTNTSYSVLASLMMGEATTDLDVVSSLVVNGATNASRRVDGKTTYFYNELYQQIRTYVTPSATGDYFIGFNAAINNTQTSTEFYLDDWSIKTFDGCVYALPEIDSVTTTTAYVSVDDTTYYQFEYVLNDTNLVSTVIDTNVFAISNLAHSTSYTLYLRRYCNATSYSEWTAVEFMTECGVVTEFPFVDGFESYVAASAARTELSDHCWLVGSTTASGYYYMTTGASYLHDGAKGLYIYNFISGNNIHTFGLPNVNTLAGKTLTMWYKNYINEDEDDDGEPIYITGALLEMGYLSDPDDVNSFVLLSTAPVATTFSEASIDYPSTVPAGARAAFRANGNYYLYVDDVSLSVAPTCREPESAPVFVSATMTTATVSVDMNGKSQSEVAWVSTSDLSTILGTVTTTDGNAVITNLTGSTTYGFKYRFICAEGDTSAWSPVIRGTTKAYDCFAPQNLRAVNVSDHHAAITWGKAPEAVGYEYMLKCGNMVIDSAFNLNDTIVYDSLAANTSYIFTVRTYCADDTSTWETISFQTTYPIFAMPFVCDFENSAQNSGWQMRKLSVAGNNEFVVGNAKKLSGSKALYVSDDYFSYRYANTAVSVSDAEILLDIPAGNYSVSYDWTCEGDGVTIISDFGRVFLVPASTTVSGTTPAAFSGALPAGAISLDYNMPLVNNSGWTNHSEILAIPNDGIYKLVVVWANKVSNSTADPIAIDNIRIEEISCMPVSNVEMITVNSTDAQALVARYDESAGIEYAISTVGIIDSVSAWTIASSDTISLTSLMPETAYYLFVRHICTESGFSPAMMIPFKTLCMPFVVTESTPYSDSFENLADSEILAGCYTVDGQNGNYVMRGYSTNDATRYSHSGNQCLYSYQSYPAVADGQTAYRQLHLTAGKDYKASVWVRATSYIGNFAGILMGVKPIVDNMTVVTSANPVSCSESASSFDACWQQISGYFTVPETGDYFVALRADRGTTTNNFVEMYFDDFVVEELVGCLPSVVTVDSVTSNAVYAHHSDNEPTQNYEYRIMIGEDVAVPTTILTNDTFMVTGLESATDYVLCVRHDCGDGEYSEWSCTNFRTDCGIVVDFPYSEDFESYIASSSLKDELDNNCWMVSSTSTAAYYYITTNTSYVHEGDKSLYIYNEYTAGTTQTFAMPEVDTLAGKRLSMWYKNYGTSSTHAKLEVGYLTDPGDANSFVLMQTAPLNSSSYSECAVNYPANVPVGARPAFRANGTHYMVVDKIRLNKLIQSEHYYETLCFGTVYNDHGFNFPAGSLAAGDTTITGIANAVVSADPDTFVTLTLHVLPELVTEFYDTVCAGQPYNVGLFNIPVPESKLYFNTFPGASADGCDTTVSLYLYVCPTRETINDTICQGDVYAFDGQSLTQTGVYTAYSVNKWGCNDTTVLNLFVVDSVVTTDASICEGESYQFEGQNYTQSGTYRIDEIGAHGCTVSKVLNLTVYETDTIVNVSFCHGDSVYVVDTVINAAGTYTLVRKNVTGCDVTYNITVTEIAPVYSDTTVTIMEGESYTWNGNTYSIAGDYTDTLMSVETGCDSIATLYLIVTAGVENVVGINISIIPNPVSAGQTSFVYSDFENVKSVDILNSFGQVIGTLEPKTYPIEVRGINTSGVYYVRVTTEDDKVVVEKLIVK